MPGFPREEQQLLASLVGAHRRKLNLETLEDLMPPWHLKAEYLIVLLRLAVLLHRDRGSRARPEIDVRVRGRNVELEFPKGWLDGHPLTVADLEQEVEYLQTAGFRLRVN
jgi:exopolyphosphatase/guanosine-5'-triphosphate,3'-diphosphate pyrophosphatase